MTVDPAVEEWVERSPYGAGLGVELAQLTDTAATLVLPFHEVNSNPGDALHGGCAASLGVIGAHAVARRVLGPERAPFHTAACHVSYLAAAIGDEVVATTRLLRRGKEMCFADTVVETADGKAISQISALVRGRSAAAEPALTTAAGDDGAADPGPMGAFIATMPFTGARRLTVDHMAGARSRIRMPLGDANADLGGGFHEGAVLALLDTTGAMAAWAATGPGRFKASTAALAAGIFGVVPAGELVGYGRVVQRDGDLFWADVEIAATDTALVHARGTVTYRIVT